MTTEPRLTLDAARRLLYALVREWTPHVVVSRRRGFVDLDCETRPVLDMATRHRLRLFVGPVGYAEIDALREEAEAADRVPVVVAMGAVDGRAAGRLRVEVIDRLRFEALRDDSGVVVRRPDGTWDAAPSALSELSDARDRQLSFLGGLVWLRTLSKNRRPPALLWTGQPASDLFEQALYVTMTSTFQRPGASWGSRARGKAVPDGVLDFGSLGPVLYDCKASAEGYAMSHRDVLGFAHYLNEPIGWSPAPGVTPGLLVVSSTFRPGSRQGSFASRAEQLGRAAPGAALYWLEASDLARFGVAIERAGLSHLERAKIDWPSILKPGAVRWGEFAAELARLGVAEPASPS